MGLPKTNNSRLAVSRNIFTVFLLTAVCITLCSTTPADAQRHRKKNKEPKPHHEDLTDHRLSLPDVRDTVIRRQEEKEKEILPASNAVNGKVDEVLDSIALFNKSRLFIDGYTIQIYSGLKREEAMNAKKKIADEAQGLTAELNYIQPKWRVKTGSYFTRLEAQRDLHRLKRIFPNAILIPEKVALR
jgi:hypothetical protein